MNTQTVGLSAGVAAVGVTITSLMVPDAVTCQPMDDALIREAHVSALAATAVLGIALSLLDHTIVPLAVGLTVVFAVVYAHDRIQHSGVSARAYR